YREAFGANDEILKEIERKTGTSAVIRDHELIFEGERPEDAAEVVRTLFEMARSKKDLSKRDAIYAISLLPTHETKEMLSLDKSVICHTASGKPVTPKTLGQKKYVEALSESMITFAVGPAGTGKTYLAIAKAVEAFRNQEVSKIILTRPAIEAGEKLGFLPGDLQSKIDPYLRPLYDALFQIMGADQFQHHLERGEIEVAPLAYMRGRTLDNAFIILDEAQNTTPAQMKMFLTRLGFQSKCVVTGDRTQKDLSADQVSGLDTAVRILKNIDEIRFVELTRHDVVRHPLVQRIVEAYEKYEARMAETKAKPHDFSNRKRNG
ncbi:MAG: PhoH family protein, partial [Lachnospiraceae bacterium]|nr:PhoH family protein [Lachnospiraceae bacterium]